MFWCVDDDNMCVWSLNVNPKISLRNNRIGYIKQRERQRENITSKKYVKINIRIIIIIKTVFFLYFFFGYIDQSTLMLCLLLMGFFFCFCFFFSGAFNWQPRKHMDQPTNQPTNEEKRQIPIWRQI